MVEITKITEKKKSVLEDFLWSRGLYEKSSYLRIEHGNSVQLEK